MTDFHDSLLVWARAHGRRLAFRETTDPYRILVAETMAQQTQVSRVEPAVEAFLAQFPTVELLAAAATADVLRAWRGLGYNRRALNLQRAARLIVERHGGKFPADIAALLALPGVGPYTARAVAVHAFGVRVAPIDTNVRRVLGRVRGGDPDVRDLQAYADSLVPREAATWTNALMDLGAAVCRPARPACDACPLRAWCRTAPLSEAPIRARPRAAAGPAAPSFERSTRWLRGRILDRLRDVPADDWAAFDDALGVHAQPDVVAMLAILAAEGLAERHATAATLARLPR